MKTIADLLICWYEECHRDLPWRHTRDPYRIWVSEVILQQTRIAQGLEYYNRFVARFPDVASLAAASQEEVMKYWQGLGYYSRARNLREAARQIVSDFGGRFPDRYPEVLSLKGIGAYTAAAICSFAYRMPYAVVDGNVLRVLARLFALSVPIDSGEGKRHFAALAQRLLDPSRPDLYNQAVMEFGAQCCTPRLPRCESCPLSSHCAARAEGKVDLLPVKSGKTAVKDRYFHFLHIRSSHGETILEQRTAKDIWQGLYQFPLIEAVSTADFEDIRNHSFFKRYPALSSAECIGWIDMPRHVLSHRIIHSRFFRLRVRDIPPVEEPLVKIRESTMEKYAIPRLIEAYCSRKEDPLWE